jgi:hypothetical protein
MDREKCGNRPGFAKTKADCLAPGRFRGSVKAKDQDANDRGNQILLEKLDRQDDENGGEIDAAENYRKMLADEIEDRIGDGMEHPDDGIVGIRLDPGEDGGNDNDPEIQVEKALKDLRDP